MSGRKNNLLEPIDDDTDIMDDVDNRLQSKP